jgi:hypothetical protein
MAAAVCQLSALTEELNGLGASTERQLGGNLDLRGPPGLEYGDVAFGLAE